MYNFQNDYNRGCHPKVLENLQAENGTQFYGYSEDPLTQEARGLVKKALGNEDCHVHFLSGGTQCNLTVISSVLRPHQGVISSGDGHINTHETGAIEATGHKVITLDTPDGKLRANQVRDAIEGHYGDETHEHIVQPGMVYISNPTELGTIYQKAELEAIHAVCKEYHIPLYMDGARLAMALTARDNDVDFKDLCDLCDIFYIGGTKCGTLIGECLVLVGDRYKKDFRYVMKQKGAMLAKGFVMSSQFKTMFTDNLYLDLGAYTNRLAEKIGSALDGKVDMFQKQVTNQIFPILSNDKIDELKKKYDFYVWCPIDEKRSAVRICVFWGTDEEVLDELIADILA
jgi:threonine aldolase